MEIYRRLSVLWIVDGNKSESYAVNEFATSDVETSRFVIGM